MYDYAPDTPTQPIPVFAEPRGPRLPLGRLAAVCAVSIFSGVLLASAQDCKAATASEPAFARVAGWAAADICLAAGALSLFGLAGFALWGAVAAVNRRSDQRRAALAETARAERAADRNRLRDIALHGAHLEAVPVVPPRSQLQVVRDNPAPCIRSGHAASGR